MVNKKALSLAVAMALVTSGVMAADNSNGTDSKLTKYQQSALVATQQAVTNQLTQNQSVPKAVSLNVGRTIDLALLNNRTLKQSSWAYEAAKAEVSATAAAKNPSVGYKYTANRASSMSSAAARASALAAAAGNNTAGSSSVSNTFSHGLTLSVPVYTPAADAALEASRFSREGAGAAYEVARQTAKLTAATDYYSLIQARNKVDIANQSVKDYDGHLTNVNQQYAVGLVAKSDVLASQTSLSQAQTDLVTAQNAANIAEASLNNVIGLPVHTSIQTADKELGYTPYPITIDEARAYALLHRYELVQSTMAVKEAEQAVVKAKAGDLPTVNASMGKGWQDTKWQGTGDNNWSVGATVSWSVWDGGASKEQTKVAKASLEKAKEANAAAVDSVLLDVRKAYLNLRAAEQTITSTKAATEEAQENFRIATLRYQAGVGTNLDVLDAETKLASARNSYVDALYNYNISVATLEQAMGVPVETPIGGGAVLVKAANATADLQNLLTSASVAPAKQ